MAGFEVDYKDVLKIAEQQFRLAEDADAGKSYVTTNTNLAFNGEGIINLIAGGHSEVTALAERFHETLQNQVAARNEVEFRDAGDYYHRTDKKSAESLDNTYPQSDVEAAKKDLKELPEDKPPFADLNEPTARYVVPPDYNAEFPHEPALWDLVSPTALARDAVWTVTWLAAQIGLLDRAYDPLETFVKPLSGDWAKLRGCADVYWNVALALGDMADNVQGAGQQLEGSWRGNAADSAQVYLFELAKSLTAAMPPFEELANQYIAAAEGAAELGKVVGSLLCDLVDAALIAIAAAEGVAVTAGTIVGIPLSVLIADAAVVAEIVKAVQIVLKLYEIMGYIDDLMTTLQGAQGRFGRIVVPENMPRLDPSSPAHLPP